MQSQEKSKDGLKKKLFGGIAAVVVVLAVWVGKSFLVLGKTAVRATDEVAVGVSKLATPDASQVGTRVGGAAASAAARRAASDRNGAGTQSQPSAGAPRGVAP
jgi:hypothetical protein